MAEFVKDFLHDKHLPDSNYDVAICEYVFDSISLAVDTGEINWDDLSLTQDDLRDFMYKAVEARKALVKKTFEAARVNKDRPEEEQLQRLRDLFIEMAMLTRVLSQHGKNI